MSLEQQISELNATIKTLNETIKLLLQRDVISAPQVQVTIPPVQEVSTQAQPELIPAIVKDVFSREELQTLCLDVIRRNEANRTIVKAIMLQHFNARKTSDLADNQIGLCYNLIKEATQDD